jgi:hypothetical protein
VLIAPEKDDVIALAGTTLFRLPQNFLQHGVINSARHEICLDGHAWLLLTTRILSAEERALACGRETTMDGAATSALDCGARFTRPNLNGVWSKQALPRIPHNDWNGAPQPGPRDGPLLGPAPSSNLVFFSQSLEWQCWVKPGYSSSSLSKLSGEVPPLEESLGRFQS